MHLGPLGRPTARKITEDIEVRDWDPTDPDRNNPWSEYLANKTTETKPKEEDKNQNQNQVTEQNTVKNETIVSNSIVSNSIVSSSEASSSNSITSGLGNRNAILSN